MGKTDMTSEPSMEELLATIRKAITDDTGIGAEQPSRARQSEILELRNKVSGKLNQPDPAPPLRRAHYDHEPAPPRQNGFAGLLGGESDPMPQAPYYRDEQVADLRPGYAEDPEPPRMWQPEAPRALGPPPAYRPAYAPPDPVMLSPSAAAQTNAAFGQLAETLMARAMGERSIEHMTQELLRTMLKQWLDEHLPSMVERLVREEIERVARRGPMR
jgi:uncharacterized protein